MNEFELTFNIDNSITLYRSKMNVFFAKQYMNEIHSSWTCDPVNVLELSVSIQCDAFIAFA